MNPTRRRLDRVLDPAFLDGLEQLSTDEVRTMRTDSSEEEALLSYERRVIHGRLAILRAEADRRAGRRTGSIVDMLPEILGDERGTSRGSFPGQDPHITFDRPNRWTTKLISDDTLVNLGSLSDDDLKDSAADLERAEREVSETRARLFTVLDRLNAEIARRYKSGEATPGDLLGAS